MTDTQLEGGCMCGTIRFRVFGPTKSPGICHCRSCQHAAGADSVGWAVFPVSNFAWISNEPKVFESSKGVNRTFCGDCGSSLTYQSSAKTIDVTLVCLDDPDALPPTKEIWLSHRRPWNALNPELNGFPEFSSSSTSSDT